MKKGAILALSLVAAISLNAAVLATVNGANITDEDIAPALGGHMEKLDQIPAKAKRNLLDRVIERELMLQQADKDNIQNDPEYKKDMLELSKNVAINVWMKKQFDAIKIDEKKVKEAYEANKNKYVIPAQVRAKHILVKTDKEAMDILKSLKGLKGEALTKKFEELAKSKSIDQGSALNGGELGWFGESQMVPEFAKAAFALKKGQISTKPVKSEFGYHIILKEDSKDKTALSYDKVKPEIENQLKSQEFREIVKNKLDELKKNAKIEYK